MNQVLPRAVRGRRALIPACALALWFGPGAAAAQVPIVRPERLPAFTKSVAGTDDTTSLVQNPANLAYMPGTELRWHGTYLEDDVSVPWQGHSFAFGMPLWWGFAAAMRADFMSPPSGVGLLDNSSYQWWTWGLAYQASPAFSFGSTFQAAFSSADFASGLASFSFGMSVRPTTVFGISLVAADVNSPQNNFGVYGRSFTGALALRPLGTRTWEMGLESKYLHEEDIWVPRATMAVDIPYVGRLSGDFAISEVDSDAARAWTSSAQLALYGNVSNQSTELAAGVVTGDGLGKEGSWNLHTGVAFKSWREPVGIPPDRQAIQIRLEGTPDTRTHVAFLRQLWSLAEESYVDAVVLELRASPADSLARVEELRDAVFQLRRSGKRVLCHLEDANGTALYLCAAANRTLINPGGGLRFAGLRLQYLYFAALLEKIGVQADFMRIGDHKSAPESFTRRGSTEVSQADKIDLLQQMERRFVEDVALGRNMTVEELRTAIKRGPFFSAEARKAGLVDGYAFDDEIQAQVNDLVGRPTPLSKDIRSAVAPSTFGLRDGLAMIYVDGDMVDGRSMTIPFLGFRTEGSYTIADAIKASREDPRIKAVVLRVESPGGSSMAAEVIWRAVELTAKVKPVIVSMGSMAASGGYYISAPATRIFANPLTITGSIGIYYGKADVSGLLRLIGVDVETYKTAPKADAESFFRPFTDVERKELQEKIGLFYDLFLRRVAAGRKLTVKEVDAVGQGRVWTGEQALEHKLVDELGGLRQALAYARKLGKLDADCPVYDLPVISTSLLGRLLGVPGVQVEQFLSALPPQLASSVRAVAPFVMYPNDKPMARLPYAILE